jgi:tRNA-Thr(GGU) m(6)t(6)A37 methyltransferase TsaA
MFELRPIGRVESELRDLDQAPKQGDEGAPRAWLVLDPEVAAGVEGIAAGDHLELLTWLDRAGRDALSVHPRGDTSRAPLGVFATRSPSRPNPIGLHRVRVEEVGDGRLLVDGLEAIDGTPIVDLKPALETDPGER